MSVGEIALNKVVTFDEITQASDRSAVDADSTPTFAVFEDTTDTAILAAQNFVKRTGLTGNYRGTFTCSAANGFEVGKSYNVVSSATVNSISGKKKSMTFLLKAAENVVGVPVADIGYVNGSPVTSSTTPIDVNLVNVNSVPVACTFPAAGVLAAQADVYGAVDNVNIVVSVPPTFKRPNSGSVAVRFTVQCHSYTGAAADADSAPTVAVANQSGTLFTSRLQDAAASGTSTMAKVATGQYDLYYLVTSADALDNLVFTITTAKNGVTKVFRPVVQVAETDPLTGDTYARIGAPAGASIAADIAAAKADTAAIKAKTDNLPAAPAAVSDIPTAATNADALIGRNIKGGSSAGRTVGQALAASRNKVAFDVPGVGQFTVFDTDDTTPLWTGTYTASAGANPVTVLDPA